MRPLRLLATLLVAVGLVVGAGATRASTSPSPGSVPCAPAPLASAFGSSPAMSAVASFGCEGPWAYVWATLGVGPHAVGVTEVLHYDATTQRWRPANRGEVCVAHHLPWWIYLEGCFSN